MGRHSPLGELVEREPNLEDGAPPARPEATADLAPGLIRIGRRDAASLDELRRATFATDTELCGVALRKLLQLWRDTPEYPLPGKPVDRVALASRIREMARQ